MSTNTDTILSVLGTVIAGSVAVLESERHYPGVDSDRSDEKIAALQARVKDLRRIREELELIFADPRA